jgi:CheY-like chemotaxis protein
MVRADRPDVIVTDLGMPGQSGYELLKRLRALPATQGGLVPAIALTAYARPEHRRAATDAGFDHYLTKPVDFEEIIAAVARLGRHPPHRG